MGIPLEKSGHLIVDRGSQQRWATEKPKSHGDLGLCLALVVLLALALFASL